MNEHESIQKAAESATFENLGIAPKLLEIIKANNFTTPTPIQLQSIPVAVQGKDVVGIAQTGTGKTLAFGIPMLQLLAVKKGKGLVVLPTRELAIQVESALYKLGKNLGLKTAVLIGGEPIGKQLRALRMNPHILIATPGRLIDHLQQHSVKLNDTHIVVLDEADHMFDMGFAPQIKQILQHLPAQRQTMLFSATMPDPIMNLAKTYMQLPIRIEVAPAGTTAKNISQEIIFVHQKEKPAMLSQLLKEHTESILVFTRTKFGAKKIAKLVNQLGSKAAEIHSNRSLSQRKDALEGFKSGRYRVLVATDIAARGIDVSGISLVVNYDLPEHAEDYVHRIGRTARAGKSGLAISLATPEQRGDVRSIERVIKMILPVTKTPTGLPSVTLPQAEYETSRYSRPNGRSNSSHGTPRPSGRFNSGPKRYSSNKPSSHRLGSSSGPTEFRPSKSFRRPAKSTYKVWDK